MKTKARLLSVILVLGMLVGMSPATILAVAEPPQEGYTVFRPGDANTSPLSGSWDNVNGIGNRIDIIGLESTYAGRAQVKVGYTLSGAENATLSTLSFAEILEFPVLTPTEEVQEATAKVALDNVAPNNFGVFANSANVKIAYIAVENLSQSSDLNVRFNITPKDADVTVTVNDVTATNTERPDPIDYSVTTFTGYNAGDTLNYTITAPGYQTQTGTVAAAWNIPITLMPEESDPALEGYTVFKPGDANTNPLGGSWDNVNGIGNRVDIGLESTYNGWADMKVGYTLDGAENATLSTLSFAEVLEFPVLVPTAEVQTAEARVALKEGGNSFGVFANSANVKIAYIAIKPLENNGPIKVRVNVYPQSAPNAAVSVGGVSVPGTPITLDPANPAINYTLFTFEGHTAGEDITYTVTADGYTTQTATVPAAWDINVTLVPETVTSTTVTFNVTPADAYVTLKDVNGELNHNVRKQAEGGVCTFSDIQTEQTLNYTVAAPGFVYEDGAVEIVENTEKTVSLSEIEKQPGYTYFWPGENNADVTVADTIEIVPGQWWGGMNGNPQTITVRLKSDYTGLVNVKVGYMTHGIEANQKIQLQTPREFGEIVLEKTVPYLEGTGQVSVVKNSADPEDKNVIVIIPNPGPFNLSYIAVEQLTQSGKTDVTFNVTPENAQVVLGEETKTAEGGTVTFNNVAMDQTLAYTVSAQGYVSKTGSVAVVWNTEPVAVTLEEELPDPNEGWFVFDRDTPGVGKEGNVVVREGEAKWWDGFNSSADKIHIPVTSDFSGYAEVEILYMNHSQSAKQVSFQTMKEFTFIDTQENPGEGVGAGRVFLKKGENVIVVCPTEGKGLFSISYVKIKKLTQSGTRDVTFTVSPENATVEFDGVRKQAEGGVCTFTDVAMDRSYIYTVSAQGYNPKTENLLIEWNTNPVVDLKDYDSFTYGDEDAVYDGDPQYCEKWHHWGGMNLSTDKIHVFVKSDFSGEAVVKIGYMTNNLPNQELAVEKDGAVVALPLTQTGDYLETQTKVRLVKNSDDPSDKNEIIVYPYENKGGTCISYIKVEKLIQSGTTDVTFTVSPENAQVVLGEETKTAEGGTVTFNNVAMDQTLAYTVSAQGFTSKTGSVAVVWNTQPVAVTLDAESTEDPRYTYFYPGDEGTSVEGGAVSADGDFWETIGWNWSAGDPKKAVNLSMQSPFSGYAELKVGYTSTTAGATISTQSFKEFLASEPLAAASEVSEATVRVAVSQNDAATPDVKNNFSVFASSDDVKIAYIAVKMPAASEQTNVEFSVSPNGATVNFNGEDKIVAEGKAVFENVAMDQTLDYTVSMEGYVTQTGSVAVNWNTTIAPITLQEEAQDEKYITFLPGDENTSFEGGVIIADCAGINTWGAVNENTEKIHVFVTSEFSGEATVKVGYISHNNPTRQITVEKDGQTSVIDLQPCFPEPLDAVAKVQLVKNSDNPDIKNEIIVYPPAGRGGLNIAYIKVEKLTQGSQPETTNVVFNVTPEDAKVKLGETTQTAVGGVCTFENIEVGQTLSYTVSADGYTPESGTLDIAAGMGAKTVNLAPFVPETTNVVFNVTPENAKVELGETTQTAVGGVCTFENIAVGQTLSYTVFADGYLPESGRIDITAGMGAKTVNLAVDSGERTDVTFIVNPQNAQVVFDGVMRQAAGGVCTFTDVPVGKTVKATVYASGYNMDSQSLTITGGMPPVEVTLTETTPDGGSAVPPQNGYTVFLPGDANTSLEGIIGIEDKGAYKKWNGFNEPSDKLHVKVPSAIDGTAIVKVAYSCHFDNGMVKTLNVESNGTVATQTVPLTGDWEFFKEVEFVVPLEKKENGQFNTVSVYSGVSCGLNVLYVAVQILEQTDVAFAVTPQDAQITLNGQTVDAQNGAYTFTNVQYGTYTYEVTREGYLPQTGTLLVDENIKTVKADLEKDPTGAEVNFMVEPKNANVKVNGVVKTAVDGKCTFLFVLLGDTEYEVSAPGYETKKGTMFVEEGMDVVSVTLDKKKTADVTFTVTPQKAKISFNGETVTLSDGQYTFKDVPVGDNKYTVSADGYVSESGTVNVDAASVNAVRVTLRKKDDGGGSSTSSGKPSKPNINLGPGVITPTPTPSPNPGDVNFTDINTVPWAVEAITALAKDGVIAGYGNGEFKPNAQVTREEFVKMLVKCFNIKASGTALNFSDVPAENWAYESIGAAVSAGIVKGVSESAFGMGQPVSRQDAAVMLMRALEYLNKNLTASGSAQFADENEIADYAKQAVALLASSGVISGREDGTFAPNAGATRAEIAKLLYELKTRLA